MDGAGKTACSHRGRRAGRASRCPSPRPPRLPVRLFDVNDGPQADPRAATTHPATLELLAEAGLVDDMIRVGLVAPILQFWDRPTGTKVAEFDHALLAGDTRFPFVVQCEQFKTAQLILDRLERLRQCRDRCGATRSSRSSQSADDGHVQRARARTVSTRHDGAFAHRRRWRPQRRAQGVRHRVRGLHLARALHRADDAVRFRRPRAAIVRAAISPIPRNGAIASRSRRRPAGPVAHRLPDPARRKRRRADER